MAFRMTSAIAAPAAAAVLALGACGEAEDGTSAEVSVNFGIGYYAECKHIPDAADAVSYNAAEAPPVVQIATTGVEGSPPCPTWERSREQPADAHPPHTARPAAKLGWWARIGRFLRLL